jgi:hypothetical protein
MNDFSHIQCVSGTGTILLERITDDKPYVKIFEEVDEKSMYML